MPNIKVKGPDGEVLTFEGVERVLMDDADGGPAVPFSYGDVADNITIPLYLAEGDQQVVAEDGMLVKSATIIKPTTLTPGNIKSGVEVAGVVGKHNGEGEPVTVELDMAEGDQMVTPPTEGKWLASVTVKKPEGLTPDNIRLGVEVGGITGTLIGDTEEVTVDLDFSAGSVTDILPLTTYSGFAFDSGYNAFMIDTAVPYTLTIGETYLVAWDGIVYECVCQDGSAMAAGGVILGNAAGWGFSGNNEPFVIATNNSGYAMYGALTDIEDGGEHTARIYQGTEGYADMEIIPSEDGKVLSKVTIKRPGSLVPGNIKMGVEIAGVTGTFGEVQDKLVVPLSFITYKNATKDGVYTGTGSKTETLDVSLTLPSGAFLLDVWCGGGVNTQSTNANGYGVPALSRSNTYSKTTGASGDTISYTYSSYIANRQAATLIAAIYAAYVLPGINLEIEGDVVTLKIDSTVTEYTGGNLPQATPFSVADLSSCTLTELCADMFKGHTALESVIFPHALTSIGGSAFYGCTALTSAVIPDGVTSIGDSAFYGCTGITSVTIPDSVDSLGTSAFKGCKGLTSVTIPDGVTSIGGSLFYNCTGLTSVTLPASVASYGTQVFRNCSSLVSVALPSGVTSIGNYDFYGCKGLTSVGIPDGVTSIGTYAFRDCTSLASVVIPDGVTSIGTYAFYNCNSLVEVDMSRCTSVPTLANNNFNRKPAGLQIKVPASLYDSFIAATNWSALASYIVAV